VWEQSGQLGAVQMSSGTGSIVFGQIPLVVWVNVLLVKFKYFIVGNHTRIVKIKIAGNVLLGHFGNKRPQIVNNGE